MTRKDLNYSRISNIGNETIHLVNILSYRAVMDDNRLVRKRPRTLYLRSADLQAKRSHRMRRSDEGAKD